MIGLVIVYILTLFGAITLNMLEKILACRCEHGHVKHYNKIKVDDIKRFGFDYSCDDCDCVDFAHWFSYVLTCTRRVKLAHLALSDRWKI